MNAGKWKEMTDMAMQERMPGNAHQKRSCWQRGNGSYSMRGELRRGISLNKKYLNRKVRTAVSRL